jgi:peptidoglycan hydrolase-like protein with peptidoglycan-binding domain
MIPNRKTVCFLVLIAVGLVLGRADLAADSGGVKRTVARRQPGRPAHRVNPQAGRRAQSVKYRKARASRRRPSHRIRLAQIHLQPERVEEIQRALLDAGYLKEEPNGTWDDATRSAMRRYQVENGFPATGLPEAKSLMKLGLGPHPLPEDLTAGGSSASRIPPDLDGRDAASTASSTGAIKPPSAAQP